MVVEMTMVVEEGDCEMEVVGRKLFVKLWCCGREE